jgi:hypothetical protein
MYRQIIAILALSFLVVGCSSKKYYEPQKVAGNIKYTKSLKTTLADVSRDGATYQNGQVIAKRSGLLNLVIPKGFRYINESESKVIITSGSGEVKVLDEASNVIFEKAFDRELVSGAIKGNLLAMVFGDNQIMLYDISNNHMIYKEALVRAVALDARLANPKFLNDLVVFPTLDGRLLIMDSRKKIVLRDVAISNKALFNNVLFLDVLDNTLIAATASKVISIDPKQINNLNIDVKDIIYKNHKVYVFTKSGKVLLCDENLKKLKEIQFPHALFSAVFENGKLYIVEKKGYLIEIEPDLSSYRVLKMPDEIENSLFATGNKIYFDSHILDIK